MPAVPLALVPAAAPTHSSPTLASGAAGPRVLTPEALAEWSDADLVRSIRSGDMQAAGTLYSRHLPFAVRTARVVGGAGIAEDLASEALTKVVAALLNGRGPDSAVRAYLGTTIRNLFTDRHRRLHGEVLVDPTTGAVDRVEPDPTDLVSERSLVLEVLAELPERWREVLWRTIVLEQPLADVGASMGLSASATAALSYRARNAFTKAYVRSLSPDVR